MRADCDNTICPPEDGHVNARNMSMIVMKHTYRAESAVNRCTVQSFTESDDTRCCVNAISSPEDGHVNARNMSRIIV